MHQISFRTRLNVLFLVLMLIFMMISSLISYFVSKSLIIDSMEMSNEKELTINIETMEELIYKSKDKYQLFIDDFNLSFEGSAQDNLTLIKNAFDFNSELRIFLYTNKEFKGIFLNQDSILVGTSLLDVIISFTDNMKERDSSQSVEHYLLNQLKENWEYGENEFFVEILLNLIIDLEIQRKLRFKPK